MFKPKLLSLIIVVPLLFVFSTASKAIEVSKQGVTIVLEATNDFIALENQSQIWYVDKERASLAVDAEKFKKKFASVQTIFDGQQGDYKLTLTSLVETDGESQYKVSVNDKPIGLATNPESTTDFNAIDHDIGHVSLDSGDRILVQFNSATNGKIPEGDSTAYSRVDGQNLPWSAPVVSSHQVNIKV